MDLSENLKLNYISCGSLLRDEMKKDTEEAKKIK